MALLVGHEQTGLSEAAHDLADTWFTIPMAGFAESFNLSVFTALCLYDFTRRLEAAGQSKLLSDEERQALLLQWLLRDTQAAPEAARRFCAEHQWPWEAPQFHVPETL